MPTNHYFSNYDNKGEQRLIEDLIIESIKIMGSDAYYLPNNNSQARDLLFGEDPLKTFTSAFPIEIYLSSNLDYLGEKEFFSKFGLQIKNDVTVVVSRRTFNERTPAFLPRPLEGDLIYIPFLNGTGELYEIKFTNQNKDFFMLGRQVPYFYELTLEKFKYSNEVIETGVPDIDSVTMENSYTLDLTMGAGSGNYVYQEIVFISPDNTYANSTAHAMVQTWDGVNKMLSISFIVGDITDGSLLIGQSSNAQYILTTYDPLNIQVRDEKYDNRVIANEAIQNIDTSESNPYGSI